MNDMRGICLYDMRPAYYALSGLLRFVVLLTQGVALGWFIAPLRGSSACRLIMPLRGLGVRSEFPDSLRHAVRSTRRTGR